ncbi:unnamed protein product [Urochloa decumbens]|uniref:DUF4220 domain-containing protein n=1 Tax=Urochloa decumbens TaxID=240449 RepID=A0ABC8XZ08_9POAL
MVNFQNTKQWWDEWQLRILVLGSLLLQFILLVFYMIRNRFISPLIRACMWLAYLGAHAMAIFTLAVLFIRQNMTATAEVSSIVEVMWAPVVLIHLGGQNPLTAYSFEDIELWRHHITTMVTQVAVALYVFCRSLPSGDKKLLLAAILLFIPGIFRIIQKSWALKSASISSLMASSSMTSLVTVKLGRGGLIAMVVEEEHNLSLDMYVQEARNLVMGTAVDDEPHSHQFATPEIEKLFVDHPIPYSYRLSRLRGFLKGPVIGSYYSELLAVVTVGFRMLYSNINSPHGFLMQLSLPFLMLPPLVLFITTSHNYQKDGYEVKDVKVTIVLLCCTTLLEFLCLFCSCCHVGIATRTAAGQQNLISFYARKRQPTKLMKLSAAMGCQGYIDKHWYMERTSEHVCISILDLVIEHVRDGWNMYIVDGASYNRFNNLRGQWTMSKNNLCDRLLQWSLLEPFDQSVLVWHVATELCLHHPLKSPDIEVQESTASRRHYSRVISNYMMYLLFIRPDMLMPGTRQDLFTNACKDIELMSKHVNEPQSIDERSVVEQVLRMALSALPGADGIGTIIPTACRLAEDLMELLGDEERWQVIQGVWVEMLCCSAGRCRGYLHAKSMGEDVEFLTVVWLLLSSMGMETFPDKFKFGRLHPAEQVVTGTSLSQPQEIPNPREITII